MHTETPTAKHRISGDGDFPEADFVTLENIPVFAEHETTAKNGKRLKFGRPELEAVAQRCNRRIQESGDYAAITIGHTPDPRMVQMGKAQMPEVIGFAGPFKIGVIGEGEKSRYAVLADMHVYKGDFDKVKKHPRRSPELWVEDTYDEMFLDPIALLGAEAPRLDMGLLYAAQREGRVIHKYAAAGPGPGSVFIPSHGDCGGKNYEAAEPVAQPTGAQGMLNPDDIRQIVDALESLDWVQFVKAQMQSAGPPEAPAAPAVGAEPPMAPEGPPAPPVPPAAAPDAGPPKEPEKDMGGMKPYSATGTVDGTDKTPEGDVDPTSGDPDASTYQEAGGKGEVKKMSKRLELLESQLADERGKRVSSERKAVLMELASEGFQVDVEKEAERCKYGRMSDEVFTDHIECIRENYQRVPFGVQLPTGGTFSGSSPEVVRANGVGPHKYSKQHHDKAFEICESAALRGEKIEYMEVLEKVAVGKA